MNRQQKAVEHQQAHLRSINLLQREPFCLRCYPVTSREKTTVEFRNFWNWISDVNPGIIYTSYTITAFEAYLAAFKDDPITEGSLTVTTSRLVDRLISSLLLDLSDNSAILLIVNLTALTTGFASAPTPEQIKVANQYLPSDSKTPATKMSEKGKSSERKASSVKNEEPINTDDRMFNEGDDEGLPPRSTQRLVQEVLMNVLGREGLNISNLLGEGRPQNARELTLVKVDPFYGREEEDPFEWIEMFKNAAHANNWPMNRWTPIAAGYLKEAARDWYTQHKEEVENWEDDNTYDGEGPGFESQFLQYFTPEAKQNKWYHELMNIRQNSTEKVEYYARRFQKLLRKVNGNREETTVPDVLQVRMFIYGLSPLLVPLVASQDPGTLTNAIERAKVVETSYNYIPNSAFASGSSEKKVDGLAEQVQKLTLNYTDLTTALLAKLANQTSEPNPRRNNNNNNNNNRPPIKCYKCGKLGHIARNCRSTQRNQDEEDEYQEAEAYRGAIESRRENQLRRVSFQTEPSDKFDVAEYVSNLPSGWTIGQAVKQSPKYRSELIQGLEEREAHYVKQTRQEDLVPTAARCDMYLNDQPITVIINTEAATNIISKKLIKKYDYKIDQPSNLIIVIANGSRVRSLGQISALPLELKRQEILTPVQVLESTDEILILGSDWLKRFRANVDYDHDILSIRTKGQLIKVPFSATRVNRFSVQIPQDEEYEEEEIEEAQMYYSDYSDESELEYNPWANYKPTSKLPEENSNPASFLVAVALIREEKPLNLGPLDVYQQDNFNNLLEKFKDVIAKSQTDIGHINVIKHKIITGNAEPIAQAPYRLNPQKKEFVRKEISDLEANGLIRKSASPWASPIVVVGKKDGSHRLCVDYRKLNK